MKFRAKCYIAGEILDWFGRDVKFSNDNGDTVDVCVKVNEQAMTFWALQYGQHIEILEPVELRDKVRQAVIEIAEKYKGE